MQTYNRVSRVQLTVHSVVGPTLKRPPFPPSGPRHALLQGCVAPAVKAPHLQLALIVLVFPVQEVHLLEQLVLMVLELPHSAAAAAAALPLLVLCRAADYRTDCKGEGTRQRLGSGTLAQKHYSDASAGIQLHSKLLQERRR